MRFSCLAGNIGISHETIKGKVDKHGKWQPRKSLTIRMDPISVFDRENHFELQI